MRLLVVLSIAASVLFSTGCLYTNVSAPLDTDLDRTALGSKVGKSEAQSVLGLFAWGDAGTQAAARKGGIDVLNHADQEIFCIFFGLYCRGRTVVYGD
jgi:hypothetical protein